VAYTPGTGGGNTSAGLFWVGPYGRDRLHSTVSAFSIMLIILYQSVALAMLFTGLILVAWLAYTRPK
jgi:hypothetical protein